MGDALVRRALPGEYAPSKAQILFDRFPIVKYSMMPWMLLAGSRAPFLGLGVAL
jgi:hypothetical protein